MDRGCGLGNPQVVVAGSVVGPAADPVDFPLADTGECQVMGREKTSLCDFASHGQVTSQHMLPLHPDIDDALVRMDVGQR